MSDTTRSFEDLERAMRGFQESRLLLTAVELDVFSAVGSGTDADQVAAALGISTRGTEILLNALVAAGALDKQGRSYRNTPETARFLDRSSPDCAREAILHTVRQWESWSTLTDCVRKGTASVPPRAGSGTDPDWTRSFIAAMHRAASLTAPQILNAVDASGVRRMLDVGGGSGAWSIAFASRYPELEAEVFDLPHVLPLTEQYIRSARLEGRVRVRAGDMLRDEFGEGYDLILLSSICHMFGREQNRDVFARCRRALAEGGRLVVRDFILNDDRCSPPHAAYFALNMLVATQEGATYTEKEYGEWLREAGFRRVDRPVVGGDVLIAYV